MSARLAAAACVVLLACSSVFTGCRKEVEDPGALVAVSMSSTVGVLLDDFPAGAMRDRVADALLAESEAFWIERAGWQLEMTTLRLIFRLYWYEEPRGSLPLPPAELWNIAIDPAGAERTMIEGHDYVAVNFTFDSTLLSDVASVPRSEPALEEVGGVFEEAFVFPVDPHNLFQRTGYACIDEDQYPPESVDEENAYLFFDDTCEVEDPSAPGCHYSAYPTESCVEALTNYVGSVSTVLRYERLAWDEALASAVRVGEVSVPDAPDMDVLEEGLAENYIVYRYFEPGHCAMVDGCLGGSGWRRLVTFDSHDHNIGGADLVIGDVDYFGEGISSELAEHGVYEYSDCHEHYHFKYYGDFTFGMGMTGVVAKNGFCLESTDRLSNNEFTPLYNEHNSCDYQGVDPGWGDLYQRGLTCNWIDITDVDTSAGPVTGPLAFLSNPDGFMCEGYPVVDDAGNQMWETTSFLTDDGSPVDRPMCTVAAGTEENDYGEVTLTIPPAGGTLVTSPCTRDTFGPQRNCGFELSDDTITCAPGSAITISCGVADANLPMVVRACEYSEVLGTGTACENRLSLANGTVDGMNVTFDLTCPAMRDAMEPGGRLSIYAAPLWEPDGTQAVTCYVL